MYLIYYSHSYRDPDSDVNEFFQDLMLSEDMTPSLDPKSDRLNAAKPERHLRNCDGMVAVIPYRDPSPSLYILFEVQLAIRARKPVLVFLEDVLAGPVVSRGVMQRRFSRRGLLRQVREHRHAMRILKTYIGGDPAPPYEPSIDQRSCLLIGRSAMDDEQLHCVSDFLNQRRYNVDVALAGNEWHSTERPHEEIARHSTLCISLAERLSPLELYLLGATRAVLTPLILLTRDPQFPFNPIVPREYQPTLVAGNGGQVFCDVLKEQIDIFEEDYLELADQDKVQLYKNAVMLEERARPEPTAESRENVVNIVNQGGTIDMSRDKIEVSNVVGPVNIKSRLDHVQQTVRNASSMAGEKRTELAELVRQLQEALAPAAEKNAEDAAQVTRAAEMVVAEATKEKPNRGMLSISAEGLKEAAKSVAEIAPTVISVAGKIAAFVAGLL